MKKLRMTETIWYRELVESSRYNTSCFSIT